MSSLIKAVRAALEFDEAAAHAELTEIKHSIRWLNDWPPEHINGRKKENARLQPLHEALLRVVEAAEELRVEGDGETWNPMSEGLASLREAVRLEE